MDHNRYAIINYGLIFKHFGFVYKFKSLLVQNLDLSKFLNQKYYFKAQKAWNLDTRV